MSLKAPATGTTPGIQAGKEKKKTGTAVRFLTKGVGGTQPTGQGRVKSL